MLTREGLVDPYFTALGLAVALAAGGCGTSAVIGDPDATAAGTPVPTPSVVMPTIPGPDAAVLRPTDRPICWPDCPDPAHLGPPDPQQRARGARPIAEVITPGYTTLIPAQRLTCWPNCPLPENIPPPDPQASATH
jgi:hypothetical protein